jgi:hypothetical protein
MPEDARRKAQAKLDEGEVPPEAAYLVEWFSELRSRCGGGMGPEPIKPTEIEAWQRLRGVELLPWELSLILALDNALLAGAVVKKAGGDGNPG